MDTLSTLAPPSALTAPRLHLPRLSPGSGTHRLLLGCGAAGPLLFAAAYSIEGATRPGYNALRDTISALSLGPSGWMQVANFVLFGVITAISAIAWRASLAPGRGAVAIPVLKLVLAVGLVAAGLSLMDPSGAPVGTVHGAIHNIASYVTLTGTWISTFIFAARFAQEPRWRWWSVFAVLSALLVIAMLAGMGMALARHGDAGLFERLATLATLPLGLAVTIRLLAGSCRVSQP
ncbi:MAG TPA: DUF998 domain-containing protein [Chloroflexota bacterium]|jgi:hypothetical protein|nr:DUF998 domain-containing protein [Chloroflexota bacterium]